jgi:hypothetical protein
MLQFAPNGKVLLTNLALSSPIFDTLPQCQIASKELDKLKFPKNKTIPHVVLAVSRPIVWRFAQIGPP